MSKPVKVRVILKLHNSGRVRNIPVMVNGRQEFEVEDGAVIEIDVDTWLDFGLNTDNARVIKR